MAEMTLERKASTDASRRGSGVGSAKYLDALYDSGAGLPASYLTYILDDKVGSYIQPLASEHDTGPALPLHKWLRYTTSSHDVPNWMRYTGIGDAQTFVVLVRPAAPTVSDIARGLRDRLQLPILDVAKLCGVKRRQFYNLLNGDSWR